MIPVLEAPRTVRTDVRLMVCIPVYGGYNALFVPSLMALQRTPPCQDMQISQMAGDSLVARARNRLAAEFLASDATHLLFLDSDLIFSPRHIEMLLEHDLPLVCGCYPKKQPGLHWVLNALPGEERDPVTRLQKVRYAGTGCMLIARETFERIAHLHPEIQYDPDDGEPEGIYHDFFRTGVFVSGGRRRYLSEDWAFCHMAAASGIATYVDTNVVLKHVGEAVYPLQDLAAPEPVAPEPILAQKQIGQLHELVGDIRQGFEAIPCRPSTALEYIPAGRTSRKRAKPNFVSAVGAAVAKKTARKRAKSKTKPARK